MKHSITQATRLERTVQLDVDLVENNFISNLKGKKSSTKSIN